MDKRRSASADDSNVGAFVVSAGLLKGTGSDPDDTTSPSPSTSTTTSTDTSTTDDIATSPRRRPGGWPHFRLPRSSPPSDPSPSTTPSYATIGTWAGIVVGASAAASLAAAGLYAGAVKRRARRASRAERRALYAEKREEDDRRVWEGPDDVENEVVGEWGVVGGKEAK
ncbi:hypothetical protein SLS58_001711 [Diplodia intermedia]|uniref:Transmembrane protein n=1 Tax=Diplodia intermedia TaxID=856260 RepID=A0ABR3U0R7_9PEZI